MFVARKTPPQEANGMRDVGILGDQTIIKKIDQPLTGANLSIADR